MKIFNSIRKKRRASLQLSINAIVILVMAMVVLGLGLTFIRGLFGKGTENLGKVLDNTQLENPANAEQKITVDRTIKLKQQGSAKLHIGYYNSGAASITVQPQGGTLVGNGGFILACSGPGATSPALNLYSATALVGPGEAVGFEGVVSDAGTTAVGTYICPIDIIQTAPAGVTDSLATTQFYVEVTS